MSQLHYQAGLYFLDRQDSEEFVHGGQFKDRDNSLLPVTAPPMLRALTYLFAAEHEKRLGYPAIITHFIRHSWEEQDKIYLNASSAATREKYKKKPWPSGHFYGNCLDTRTPRIKGVGDWRTHSLGWRVDKMQAASLRDWLNSIFVYDPQRSRFQCIVWHDVGSGDHFHLQVHPNTVIRAQAV